MPDKKQRLQYTDRAKTIVEQMTLSEKLKLMRGHLSPRDLADLAAKGYNYHPWGNSGVRRLGVPKMLFCDGPRGLVSLSATCFPVTMARGATFEPELEERVGEAIAKEIRAAGGNYYGGVCINLPYNPGWGRSQEVYGEDSVHMGKMAVRLVEGVQRHNVMACAKHFAFNSMENMRFKVSVTADKRTEREIYLRHFRQVVDAGCASVMGAYNRYRGDQCCESRYLLTDVLKKEWDFDGFVISDFVWGVRDAAKAIAAGLDVEMPMPLKYRLSAVKKALNDGTVTMEQIDESCLRIIRTVLAFTEAKDPQDYPSSLIRCDEHVALAKETALKAMTLLKNDGVLPFDKAAKKIVIVGDLAKDGNTGDHGSSWVKRGDPDNVLQVAEERFGDRVTFVGTNEADSKRFEIASADAVIAVVGMRYADEGEYVADTGLMSGGDRKDSLGLHEEDIRLIELLGSLNKERTAVVLIGGNMLMLDPWYDSVNGILMAYYPGVRGGEAIIETLFGDNNPGGKLPFVIVRDEKDLPQVDWKAEEQYYGYYHGYRRLDKEGKPPRLAYGFGLSYTSFALKDAGLENTDTGYAVFSVNITNTGKRSGSETAQLYIGFRDSAVDRPVRTLADFRRVYLAPGESKNVTLTVNKSDLAYYDEEKEKFVEEDIGYTAYIGNCNDKNSLTEIPFVFNDPA